LFQVSALFHYQPKTIANPRRTPEIRHAEDKVGSKIAPGTEHLGRGLTIVAKVSNVQQLRRQTIHENGLFPPTNAPSINVGHVILQQHEMRMSSVRLNRE